MRNQAVTDGCTYISLRRRQAELDQADLGLLYTGHSAVHHLLGQNQTIHQLTVIYGSTKEKKKTCVTTVRHKSKPRQKIIVFLFCSPSFKNEQKR